NWTMVDDGISMLEKAIQLRPDYDDAMAYINLMYRERADLECADAAASSRDLKTADEWVDKAMAAKKAKAARDQATGKNLRQTFGPVPAVGILRLRSKRLSRLLLRSG